MKNLRKYKDNPELIEKEINSIAMLANDITGKEFVEMVNQQPTQEEIIEFNRQENKKNEMVDHPTHYGGEDNYYEAIKVIEAWGLGFNLGNAVKYISRAGKKLDTLEDLEKAAWYISREIKKSNQNK
jgi:N-acyl-D-aspartate/D-glutamate deacylase